MYFKNNFPFSFISFRFLLTYDSQLYIDIKFSFCFVRSILKTICLYLIFRLLHVYTLRALKHSLFEYFYYVLFVRT